MASPRFHGMEWLEPGLTLAIVCTHLRLSLPGTVPTLLCLRYANLSVEFLETDKIVAGSMEQSTADRLEIPQQDKISTPRCGDRVESTLLGLDGASCSARLCDLAVNLGEYT